MRDFLNQLAKTVKKRPVLALKYDVSTALFASKKDEEPIKKNAAKADVKIDIVAFLAVLLAFRTALALLSRAVRKKKKKK